MSGLEAKIGPWVPSAHVLHTRACVPHLSCTTCTCATKPPLTRAEVKFWWRPASVLLAAAGSAGPLHRETHYLAIVFGGAARQEVAMAAEKHLQVRGQQFAEARRRAANVGLHDHGGSKRIHPTPMDPMRPLVAAYNISCLSVSREWHDVRDAGSHFVMQQAGMAMENRTHASDDLRLLISSSIIQSSDRNRAATRRAISADASSGIGNTELTLISPST